MTDEVLIPESLWDSAFRAAMAHRKMICEARDNWELLKMAPIKLVPVSPIIQRTSANTNRSTPQGKALTKDTIIPPPPSGRQYRKKHPLVGSLRSRLVPWVFGCVDAKLEALAGCSREQFRDHVETQFSEGMNWANHGYWHLDHIKPVASFNHDDPEQVKKCWHFTNFQPLWGRHNSQKGSKLNYGKDTNRTDSGVA